MSLLPGLGGHSGVCASPPAIVSSDQFWLSGPASLHGRGRCRAGLTVPLWADGGHDLWVGGGLCAGVSGWLHGKSWVSAFGESG